MAYFVLMGREETTHSLIRSDHVLFSTCVLQFAGFTPLISAACFPNLF